MVWDYVGNHGSWVMQEDDKDKGKEKEGMCSSLLLPFDSGFLLLLPFVPFISISQLPFPISLPFATSPFLPFISFSICIGWVPLKSKTKEGVVSLKFVVSNAQKW